MLDIHLPPSPERQRAEATVAIGAGITKQQPTIRKLNNESGEEESLAATTPPTELYPNHASQDFASRIPDLSFMLSSTLVLPGNHSGDR